MEMHDLNLCQNHLIGTVRKNAQERIAFLVLELFYRVRLQMENGYDEATNSIIFPLTQKEIGDAVGLTSVHVNRTLKDMVENGLIQYPGKRLTILNEDALMEIGEFDPGMILTKSLI